MNIIFECHVRGGKRSNSDPRTQEKGLSIDCGEFRFQGHGEGF